MIPNLAELAVLMSKWDANQQRKNKWKQSRYEALDYYKGDTKPFVEKYFSSNMLNKIVVGNINITKRVIDRISLVYMIPPIRTYTNENFPELLFHKDLKLQRLERMTNLLDGLLFKPCWRIDDKGQGHIEYDIIFDYEPLFYGDDPLKPDAYIYPINMKASVLSDEAEQFAYWDKDNHFIFDKNSKIYSNEDNPDMINPYGVLPFLESYRDGKPEYSYMDVDASTDLIQTNLAINVAETNKNANVMFQSFGYMYVNGAGIDKDVMEIGQDKINYLGIDGTINIVAPPNSVPALDESVKSSYKMLSQNYHLPVSFVEGTTAESGVALRLRNQELQDDRKSDVMKWREFEKELFELERLIYAVEEGKDGGDLEDVDFDEATEILSNQEQREKWDWELSKGIIDEADIMMQMNPDLNREEALEHLEERKIVPETTEGTAGNTLLEALAKPVE